MDKVNEWMTQLTAGVILMVREILNFIIGMIVSIYVLFSKEKFMCQAKKLVYAIFRPTKANLILHVGSKSNEIFGGFIIGKIIDSAIIGVLCFIGLSILNIPYTLLVSVIVGVTNVIPFFGPYIGAIPSALLIFLADPVKGVYFVIFIILLQQFDGNILGPKILGNSTGLCCILGCIFYPDRRRIIWNPGYAPGSTYICSDLLYHQYGCESKTEKKAASYRYRQL